MKKTKTKAEINFDNYSPQLKKTIILVASLVVNGFSFAGLILFLKAEKSKENGKKLDKS